MKRKLVITGASGFLGWHLIKLAVKDWDVYGFVNRHNCVENDVKIIQCDVCNYIELGNYLDDIEPDAVIHAAALADANFCEKNPEISRAINVDATINLAGICCDFNIPFAFTSTDLVFDGTKGMYKEADEKNPVSFYGEHKSDAEEKISEIYPDSVIFRLPFMLGNVNAGSNNYLRNMLGRLSRGENIHLFTDEYRSVGGALSIAEGILKLFGSNSGIFHLAGRERLSRYETGLLIARAANLPNTLFKAALQKDMAMDAPRPADVSMDISKAISKGYNPALLAEELNRMIENTLSES